MEPAPDVSSVVADAARLAQEGEIIVFGSAALAFWLDNAPTTRDVDMIILPPGRADVVEAIMGEEGPYHQLRKLYVDVASPETLVAPVSWMARARRVRVPGAERVSLIVPHPHDILFAKLGRFEAKDKLHAQLILAEYPMDLATMDGLADDSPYRSAAIRDVVLRQRFELNLGALRRLIEVAPSD